jgi:hypothetical protein
MTDYKEYSLEQLSTWVADAITCSGATPEEIFDKIKGVIEEEYHTYKNQTERCYELLALMNGNGKGHISAYDDYLSSTDTITFCDNHNSSKECESSWNDFWRDEVLSSPAFGDYQYYHNGADTVPVNYSWEGGQDVISFDTQDDDCMPPWGHSDLEYAMKHPKEDKVVKWQLPVEMDGPSGEYFVSFPDDLLEAAGLKEGDTVEWVDNGDGSYLLKKVENRT